MRHWLCSSHVSLLLQTHIPLTVLFLSTTLLRSHNPSSARRHGVQVLGWTKEDVCLYVYGVHEDTFDRDLQMMDKVRGVLPATHPFSSV